MSKYQFYKTTHELDLLNEELNPTKHTKIIKQDFTKNSLRVIKRFAFLPKLISTAGRDNRWIFWSNYYQLQLLSFWGKGWINQEVSLNEHEWDFKWSEEYLSHWRKK